MRFVRIADAKYETSYKFEVCVEAKKKLRTYEMHLYATGDAKCHGPRIEY